MATQEHSSTAIIEVVSRLAEGLSAEQIYLFGSQTTGKADPGSDYDLLVIVSESNLPRHRREQVGYNLMWGVTTPVDIIILTRAELNSSLMVKTSLASTALRNGILLYDRSKAT